MTRDLQPFGSWLDRAEVEAILRGSGTALGIVLAGKLLRSPRSTPELCRDLRTSLPRSITNEVLEALEATLDDRFSEADRVADEILAHQDALGPAAAHSILLLRDDIESLAEALAALTAPGTAAEAERLSVLRWEALAAAVTLDSKLEPQIDLLRDAVRGSPAPEELLDLVTPGGNPWWLDVVDPAWDLVASSGFRVIAEARPARLAAAAESAGPIREDPVERGGMLQMRRDTRGDVWATLSNFRRGDQATLAWMHAAREYRVELERAREDVWTAKVDPSAAEASVIAIDSGGRLWIVDRRP